MHPDSFSRWERQFAARSARAELPEGSIADPASYHDQSCGKCVSAKQIVLREENTPFSMLRQSRTDSTTVARARGTTNLGQFRTSCKEMIAKNSQGAALQKAHQHMRAGVGKIKTETDFLRALGYIASYSCDAPMQISLTFDETSFSCGFLRKESSQLMI